MVSVKMVIFFCHPMAEGISKFAIRFLTESKRLSPLVPSSDLKLMWKTKQHEGFLSSEYDIASQASFRSSQDNVDPNIKKQNI